jgi:hypothetical protein
MSFPPSSTDPSKPRTRTEFGEEFGWFEFYVRDKLVGIGKTEKEATEDSVLRKGEPYSLVPSFKAAIGTESKDHPHLTTGGDLTVDAQSVLRPNCASSRPEVGRVKDHGDSEEASITSLPAPSPTSEHEKKASSAPGPSVSKPPAMPLPANWKVYWDTPGQRYVVEEINPATKHGMPLGFGRTKEAAIADARATKKRAANSLAKWKKADPWE